MGSMGIISINGFARFDGVLVREVVGTEKQRGLLNEFSRRDQHFTEEYQKNKPLCFSAKTYQRTHPKKTSLGIRGCFGPYMGVGEIGLNSLDQSGSPKELRRLQTFCPEIFPRQFGSMGCCAATPSAAPAGHLPTQRTLSRLSVGEMELEEDATVPAEDDVARASFSSWTHRSSKNRQPDRSLHHKWVGTLDAFLGEVHQRPSLFERIVALRRRTARWMEEGANRLSQHSRGSRRSTSTKKEGSGDTTARERRSTASLSPEDNGIQRSSINTTTTDDWIPEFPPPPVPQQSMAVNAFREESKESRNPRGTTRVTFHDDHFECGASAPMDLFGRNPSQQGLSEGDAQVDGDAMVEVMM
eukprot:symbB.v1.2.013807.t1/scaffold980.1/size147263/6